jgi:hypothetical protein
MAIIAGKTFADFSQPKAADFRTSGSQFKTVSVSRIHSRLFPQ